MVSRPYGLKLPSKNIHCFRFGALSYTSFWSSPFQKKSEALLEQSFNF